MKRLLLFLVFCLPLSAQYSSILFNTPLDLSIPLASFSETKREVILFDPANSPLLEKEFQIFFHSLSEIAHKESKKALFTALCHYIKHTLFDPEKSTPYAVSAFVHTIEEEQIPLDCFVAERTGVCRHFVLATAYFLKRLEENGWIKGKIALIRQPIASRYAHGNHVWSLFAEDETLWHLDSYWEIVEEASSVTLINIYGEEAMQRARQAFQQPKEVFFFDLGGVLVNFSHLQMCENLATYCGIEKERMMQLLFKDNLGVLLEEGRIDSQELCKRLSTLCHRTLDVEELKKAACDIFSAKEEVISLLHSLKARGARLYLLSNTCDAHFEYIKTHFNFLDLFEGYILSYEVKARKPDPKIYSYALSLAHAPKEACAYIDDVKEYVESANSLGIPSHHFENAEKLSVALKQWGYP